MRSRLLAKSSRNCRLRCRHRPARILALPAQHPGRHLGHPTLVPALAHAAGCRLEGTRLKRSDRLLRIAGSFDTHHRDSTGFEGCGRAPADSAAQHGLTTAQRFDKPAVAVRYGDTIARCGCVFMTTGIHTLLDHSHLPIQGFNDKEHAPLSEMAADFDSVVRRYSDLHVRFSLADTDRPKHPAAHPRADSQILDDFTQYFFQSDQPKPVRHPQPPPL